jgi:hypothetical protein
MSVFLFQVYAARDRWRQRQVEVNTQCISDFALLCDARKASAGAQFLISSNENVLLLATRLQGCDPYGRRSSSHHAATSASSGSNSRVSSSQAGSG